MEIALYISASIALLALAGLFLYLVRFIGKSRTLIEESIKTAQDLVGEIQKMRVGMMGTVQNLEGITQKVEDTIDRVNGSVERVNGQLYQVEGIVASVKNMTGDASDVVSAAKGVVISVLDLEQNIQRSVERPILESMTFFSALAKGIRAFRLKVAGPVPEDRYIPSGVPE